MAEEIIFHPQVALVVQVDHNGAHLRSDGFQAGPIHTLTRRTRESLLINDHGSVLRHVSTKCFRWQVGGQNYAEGEGISYASELLLNGKRKEFENLDCVGNGTNSTKSTPLAFLDLRVRTTAAAGVEVVANDPYYDLFWVPDRDTVDVGTVGSRWELEFGLFGGN